MINGHVIVDGVVRFDEPVSRGRRLRPIANFGLIVLTLGVFVRLGVQTWPDLSDWWECQRLAGQLRSDDPAFAEKAAQSLLDHEDRGASILLIAVRDQSESARTLACLYVPKLKIHPELMVEALVRGLGDPEPNVQRVAAQAFGPRRELSSLVARDENLRERVIGALSIRLSDEHSGLRSAVAESLSGFGARATDVVDQLVPLLSDQDEQVRGSAACALIRIQGTRNTDAADALVEILSDHRRDRFLVDPLSVAGALQVAGPEFESRAMNALVDRIRSDRAAIRAFVIEIFQAMGEAAHAAVPGLESLLKTRMGLTGRELKQGLGSTASSLVGSSHAIGDAEDENLLIRFDIARALVAIKGKSSGAGIAALLDTLAEPNVSQDRRWEACKVLQKTDPQALTMAIPILIEMLEEPDPVIQADSAKLLERLDPRLLREALGKTKRADSAATKGPTQ